MVLPQKLSPQLKENIQLFHSALPMEQSFDYVTREISLGGVSCYFIAINGLCDLKVIQDLFKDFKATDFQAKAQKNASCLPQFVKDQFFYAQITFSSSPEEMINQLLEGPGLLLIDGYTQGLIIDARNYPTRGIEEPETEKVIQGAKDGFTESLLTNCNLIRRRLHAPQLTFSLCKIGSLSQTSTSLVYLSHRCDPKLLQQTEKALASLDTTSLTMGIQSLKELLIKKSFFHPMPSVFLTQRPDVACSYLTEGYLLLLADNSPFACVLPCNVFQFTQTPEDYYKSPLVGTYTRLVRFLCLLISLFLMPLFLLFCLHPDWLPLSMQQILPGDTGPLAIFIYVLFVELGLDLFKYASAHAADAFSGSLAIVGGLLLGDMAVQLNWTSEEVIFYGAATMLASLGIANIELADAVKMYRLLLILFTGFFPRFGFFAGLLLILFSLMTTPVFGQKSYFWPLFPFSLNALKTLLFRYPTFQVQPEKPTAIQKKASKNTKP